jgi:hypothetical protein
VFTPDLSEPEVLIPVTEMNKVQDPGAIFLHRASDDQVINMIEDFDIRFETPEEDMVYRVSSTEWTAGTDYDQDGYFSYRKLDVDILAAPLTRTLRMDVSICKKPIMAGPCPYITDFYFRADSTDDDVISIELGLPNAELDSGIYQFDFALYDSITGEKVMDNVIVDDNLKMEPAGSDPYVYMITDVHYEAGRVDYDGDKYFAISNLLFNIEVTGGNQPVYATLFYKPEGETEFSIYMTTDVFDIESGVVSNEMITIGLPNDQLNHGKYDFRLVIYDAETDEMLVALSPEDKRELKGQQIETMDQDVLPNPEDITGLEDILIYPNPFDHDVYIDPGKLTSDKSFLFRMYDSRGLLIQELNTSGKENQSAGIHWDGLDELIPGIYFLEIRSDEQVSLVRLVKR